MGANVFRGLSDLDFQKDHSASLLKIVIKWDFFHNLFIFSLEYIIRGKVAKKCGC